MTAVSCINFNLSKYLNLYFSEVVNLIEIVNYIQLKFSLPRTVTCRILPTEVNLQYTAARESSHELMRVFTRSEILLVW